PFERWTLNVESWMLHVLRSMLNVRCSMFDVRPRFPRFPATDHDISPESAHAPAADSPCRARPQRCVRDQKPPPAGQSPAHRPAAASYAAAPDTRPPPRAYTAPFPSFPRPDGFLAATLPWKLPESRRC